MGHISGSTLIAKYPAFVVLNWAVMISIPLQLPIAIVNWTLNPITQMPSAQSWFGYLYVSLFSLAIGNFMLNKGLYIIGLIKGPQLQLIQPVVTMVLSIWVLHVAVSPITWIAALAILISVAWSQKYRG
jgi:drug/metabolite transporter (DMT)-like permease